MFNRTINERAFSNTVVNAVWEKGRSIPSQDPNVFRKDVCGATMKKSEYGNTGSDYGWEIDHIKPKAKGGSDDLSNLQPLHWKNNRRKCDSTNGDFCEVTT